MKPQEFPNSATNSSNSDSQAFLESFHAQVLWRVQDMENLLEKDDRPEHRQQLQSHCQHLANWGKAAKLPLWVELLETAGEAIANLENPYQSSLELIIQEIQQAAEKVLAGRSDDLHLSEELQALAFSAFSTSTELESTDPSGNLLNQEIAELFSTITDQKPSTSADTSLDDLATWFDENFSEDTKNVAPNSATSSERITLTSLPSEEEISDLFGEDLSWGENSLNQQDFAEINLDELENLAFTETQALETTAESVPEIDELIQPQHEESDEETEPDLIPISQKLVTEQNLEALTTEEINQRNPADSAVALTLLDREDFSMPCLYEQFEDLEALLEKPATTNELTPTLSFEALELLLVSPSPRTGGVTPTLHPIPPSPTQKQDILEDEFKDLEQLLKQAERAIGGVPTTQTISGQGLQPRTRTPKVKVFEQTMRVPIKQLDNLSNLIGELVVKRNRLEQDQERLRQFLDNLLNQIQNLGDVGGRMQDLYERTLLEGALLASRNQSRSFSATDTLTNIDSDTEKLVDEDLNALEMDRFTGFHLLSQEMIELIVRVRESTSDIQFLVDETDQVARTLRQVTTQLQEGMTHSRMVPFAQTADRLPRAVREISLRLNKQAKLHVEGREVLIDKMILEHLYNPMTHLVNNAITHGIELPEVRVAQGKSPAGRITLRAFPQGNQTVISIADDGAGINAEQVKAKAIEKGLITAAEAIALSTQDVYDFLFHAGFTTKDQADDFSGRGVGLDVVRTSLSEVRGSVSIDSLPGKGTTFTIRLPLTLSISKALCCLSDRARIAFPMDGVEDMKDYIPSDILTHPEGYQCIRWHETLLPVHPLSELLSYNRLLSRGTVYGGKQEEDTIPLLILRSAGNLLAVEVDQVLGEQEIVIKQIEGPIPKPAGIAGATVLGDGSIMPIADVLELIEIAQGRMRADSNSNLWKKTVTSPQPEIPNLKTEPTVLIVDDSITVRELLSLSFSKAGYRVEQARDGQEAWEKLRSGLPCDIVFCDIEMPRMNGLELLSNLQKDETLATIPFALLTSRGADRHRQVAAKLGASGYFTKPYTEKDLLDAAKRMIDGEILLPNSIKISTVVQTQNATLSGTVGTVRKSLQPIVLIVDDSVMIREMLSITFTQAGYQVEQARDGLEAWEKLRSGLPCDLVFCDIEMPRMNGLELLSRLQENKALNAIPVAMITSRGAEKHRKIAAERGAKGYFTKPYIEEVLIDAAQRLMSGEILLENNSQVEE